MVGASGAPNVLPADGTFTPSQRGDSAALGSSTGGGAPRARIAASACSGVIGASRVICQPGPVASGVAATGGRFTTCCPGRAAARPGASPINVQMTTHSGFATRPN